MAAKVGNDSGDEVIGDINVVPLVDIMLVLVIILMVTAEFTKYRTVPIQLPKVNAVAMKREPHKVAITIKPNGKVYLGDKEIKDLAELGPRLVSAKKAQPDVAVILRMEKDTKYSDMLKVLDDVKLSGISKVGLAVDSAKKGK
ncbi:MAG TPA: biopolymer transporter ExbD [Turneriella sp.]|nr:biopolymer transporter ExbD [Turneriella sp.]HMY10454.1 biopolymer transporter ExbD [Turneriella sp.]HNA78941.1 biopolymer transporter ExbD [Turneriella sp.]HNE20146.1 biopolymer transporter ExbD [Turneriella sp.]HNJ67344.1 biopolymer transporter ExbD [Turneriella sp.]